MADRKRVESIPEDELSRRRRQLLADRGRPATDRRAADGRLAAIEARIAELEDRPSAGSRGAARSPGLDATAARMAAEQLGALRAERGAIVDAESPKPSPGRSADVELALIEDRLLDRRRRRVRAERISPLHSTVDALGPRPLDPLPAALWNEGVDVIVSYRQLQGIADDGGHALGPRSTTAEGRRAHLDAERRLDRVQEALRRPAAREMERAPGLSR